MAHPLLSRKWIIGHLVVVALAFLFVNFGFWQLRRLEERRLENRVMLTRMMEAPLPVRDLIAAAGDDTDSLANRRATAVGEYREADEVLIRSQVLEGTAGFHVITPFDLTSGQTLLVNRGWVPLEMDQVPVAAAPPEGEEEVLGLIRLDEARPQAPLGERPIFNRVDIAAIAGEEALPVYLVLEGERTDRLPVPLPPPDFSSDGNHLSYAIQWFSFVVIGVVGYALLLRRALRRPQGQPRDDGSVLEPVKD
jgi:surfeit locus 1 family protein